jgi:hypothetical protein
MKPLSEYRRSVYSQNGEDGVIAEINRRLGVTTGWFCEFGAWDGRYGSNTYKLLREGWSGVMIEVDRGRFARLERLAKKHPRLHPVCRFVDADGPNRLDAILAETPIPHAFGVLSVDIDGGDYHVWKGVHEYRPAVVLVEIASRFPPGVRRVHGEDGAKTTSFTPMVELGADKGYRLACHTGNLIFVREDLADTVDIDGDPTSLYDRGWLDRSRLARYRRKIRNASPQRLAVKLVNMRA